MAGVFVLAALALFVGVVSESLRRRARVGKRLEAVVGILYAEDVPEVAPKSSGGQQGSRPAPYVAMLDRRYPLSGWARTSLIALTAGVLTAACVLAALTFFGVPVLAGLPLALLVAFAAGWAIGDTIEARNRERFQSAFLVAIEDFERQVRFGVMASRAFDSMASSATGTAGEVLRKVALDVSLGDSLGEAIGREARRIRSGEMAMLSAVISVQTQVGGRLAEAVRQLTGMLRERIDNRHRMRAATSEPKISLLVLCALPFAGVGLQAATQPELFETLLSSARHLLGIGVGMILLGMVVSFFIVRAASR